MSSKIPGVIQNVDPQELYDVMCGAASQDPALMEKSTFRLKIMLDYFGAFDALHEIAAQKSVPLPVRQQSIIQFKNAALSHWRSRRLVSDEHRIRIRQRCLSFLDEPDDIIAECNEIIVSKIARQDYPNNWSYLIPDLRRTIEENLRARYSTAVPDERSALVLVRSLRLVNEVLKEFGSIKMPGGMKTMAKIVEDLHLDFYGYYAKLGPTITSTLSPETVNQPRVAEDLTISHLVFKCMVKMTTWVWHRPTMDEVAKFLDWAKQFFRDSAVQLQALSELRINLLIALRSANANVDAIGRRNIDLLTRHVRVFGKLFRRFQQLDVKRFVLLEGCSDLVFYYWSKVVQATNSPPEFVEDSPDAVFPVRFLVQAMVLFKENLAQWAPVRKDGSVNENMLSKDAVENAVQLLVTRFIPLNPSDLEEWMADPDEWVNEEDKENDHWEYEVRPCAERVLMTLANQYKDYVVPLLAETFKRVISQPTTDLASIVQKEAVYCAIGRCAIRLKDVIPFDQWLEHTLVPESQETNPSYPIIKRRIAWVIGKWVSDSCASPKNPTIWQVLVHLLQDRGPGSDAVVRLTAVAALRECVDTIDFDPNIFAPFLPPAMKELLALLAEADNLESKRRIINTLNSVVERSGTLIVPFLGAVTEPLPNLWSGAGEDWLFKASLLTTVEKLLQSSQEHSRPLTNIVVPLVQECLSPGARLQLEEDGLSMWQVAMRNAVSLDSGDGGRSLLELLPIALTLLAEDLDVRAQVIGIVESYLILDATRVLQLCAVDLFNSYVKALPQGVSSDQKSMLGTLQLLVQIAPPQLWAEPLHVSGLFPLLMKPLVDDNISVTLLTEHVYVLARIVLADRDMFLRLMSAASISMNTPEITLWEALLDQWWQRFDNMSEPRYRKLAAMSIANLVSTGRPEVLERLHSEIFNLWLDVFGELKEAKEQADGHAGLEGPAITLFWDRNEPDSVFYQESQDTPERTRRQAIFDNDPIRTVQLTAFVAARLQEAEASLGGGNVIQTRYLAKADPLVIQQIQKLLASGL
ncbi:ARM repeat-containing protein [Gloeophyllum trabeum ATCC 11539]|uniref:ARM repeat-containing protein n=1 Tax=Gloeophyllum trabeum (strain ATCC 11539 / FP-39264 / Madison 617) TaxID=670483 RepID=S7QI11_GLOTA|nr:ARM repeat-containing protein [Gloeophyllum trabeum ATCC 11539]EPQ59406.1 ARM repeat-containing protein [Gloeophyllum trabeum ATCC 11539]